MSLSSYNPQGPAEVFPGYILSPNGGLVHYVHSSGAAGLSLLPAGMASPSPGGFFTSVNSALASCRANRGDKVLVLPGHTESISGADGWSSIVAGVEVVGLGNETNRPTITWTAAGSTLELDVANFTMRNFNLYLAGAHAAGSALTVAAPITVSAAGVEISGSRMFWGFDADQIVTIGITTTAAADYFKFNWNTCYAETAAVPTTTFMRLVGADHMQMWGTKIQGAGSTTTLGPVQFLTTASLGLDWRQSIIQNQLASSVHAVTGMAGLTGTAWQCGFGILDNATAVGFVTPGNVQFMDCTVSNDNGVGSAGIPA